MATASHLELHREHLRWWAEDDLWRDDLASWEAEVTQAIKDLPRLDKALRQHTELLRKHAAAIRLYEQDLPCTSMPWTSTSAVNGARSLFN